MGLAGWLTLLFVVLKLNPGGYLDSAVQDWSWWWVFSPILVVWAIGLGTLVGLALGAGVCFLAAWLLDKRNQRKWRKQKAERQEERRKRNRQQQFPPLS